MWYLPNKHNHHVRIMLLMISDSEAYYSLAIIMSLNEEQKT